MRNFHARGVLVLALFFIGTPAFAQSARWYTGLALGVEHASADYEKNIFVPENAPAVVRGRAANETRTRSSADDTGVEANLLAGYRRGFARGAWYASAEVDIKVHSARARGRNPGSGGGRQRGENWAEDWRFQNKYSAGFTLRAGRKLRGTTSIYLLAGARASRARLLLQYTGCGMPAACGDDDFFTGQIRRSGTLKSFRAGAGFEKQLGANTALRFELHYTGHEDFERLDLFSFDDDGDGAAAPYTIRVPYAAESSALGSALSVVRYF